MKKLQILFLGLITLALAACGSSSPSTAEIEKQFTEILSPNSFSEVIKVTKTNGEKVSDSRYKINADVTFKCTKSSGDYYEQITKRDGAFAASIDYELMLDTMHGPWKKGDQRVVKYVAAFAKTEKGWKLDKSTFGKE